MVIVFISTAHCWHSLRVCIRGNSVHCCREVLFVQHTDMIFQEIMYARTLMRGEEEIADNCSKDLCRRFGKSLQVSAGTLTPACTPISAEDGRVSPRWHFGRFSKKIRLRRASLLRHMFTGFLAINNKRTHQKHNDLRKPKAVPKLPSTRSNNESSELSVVFLALICCPCLLNMFWCVLFMSLICKLECFSKKVSKF